MNPALERHDSAPEEQYWRSAGCDLDHLDQIQSAADLSSTGLIPEKGARFPFGNTIDRNSEPLFSDT
jgi:hypothetical protein